MKTSMTLGLLVLGVANGFFSLAISMSIPAATFINTSTYYSGSCTPFAWVDFALDVTDDLASTNLMFEVEDLGGPSRPAPNPLG